MAWQKVRLSDREEQVLRLVMRGMTSKEIALELGVKARTVDSYVEHIKAFLRVPYRRELIEAGAAYFAPIKGQTSLETAA